MTLEILTSDALVPVRHGFFTRRGGASSGIFKGLNCGFGSSDQREAVTLNRSRVADAMESDATDLITVHQVHSADVAVVATAQDVADIKADAMVTATPGIALGILTADCQPVLFADAEGGVVGVAHAGWKGARDGVLENTVQAMEGLGAVRSRIAAVIGPSISQQAYEVGPEFLDTFLKHDTDNARYFKPGKGDRYHFDLPAYGVMRLQQAGIAQATWTGHCTYADPSRFFSYRRSVHQDEADYGRLISVIRL